MKPYQQIEEAKKKAQKKVEAMSLLFQQIADDYSEETGGVIRQVCINFSDVTAFGDEYPKCIIASNEISI